MRVDAQIAAIESETDRLLKQIQESLQGYRFMPGQSGRLGTRQFEDVGKVYERRGGPFAKKFLESKNRDSRTKEERSDLLQLGKALDLVQRSPLDIHMKAFIIRKLPLMLESTPRR